MLHVVHFSAVVDTLVKLHPKNVVSSPQAIFICPTITYPNINLSEKQLQRLILTMEFRSLSYNVQEFCISHRDKPS